MCGIFGIVSKPIDSSRLNPGPESLPDLSRGPAELKRSLSTLDFYLMHQAYTQASAREHWKSMLGRIGDDAGAQAQRDVTWRIEHDLLEMLEAMSALLEDPEYQESGAAVWLAWQVELTLRGLGRMEVRGRDSAGLAVQLWFGDDDARDRILTGTLSEDQVFRHSVPGTGCLVLSYKVAEEVGALGFNESTLRTLIREDEYFQQAVRAAPRHAIVLAHTRWASNGIISIGNAHPIDGFLDQTNGSAFVAGATLAVANGDVDNHLDLVKRLEAHGKIPGETTTDAKVIPALVEASVNGKGSLDPAVLEMMELLEGSVATVLTRAEDPGVMWCGLKGTGQALYLADAGDAMVVASEVYGTAELTESYWPLEQAQQRRADGHDAVLVKIDVNNGARPCVHRLSGEAPICLEPDFRSAEITTRDVDRRGFTHYFRKELEEAIDSVRKTIHGRYQRRGGDEQEPEVDFSALYSHAEPELFEQLRQAGRASSPDRGGRVSPPDPPRGGFRRFVFVGQGSAHVAGKVGARFVAEIVRHLGMTSHAMTAGDFSAHELRSDLSDTCMVAISQSGTTTDTNRCLALARERGARVVGIVNRRDSAMVELCDAVMYTSDGRDIEMAVASTKAFYSQVVASFMFAQHVGLVTGSLVHNQVASALMELERLPRVMQSAFEIEGGVEKCARAVGLSRRHWSVLGSGASLATGEEIRIKFSELCYKSVSVDILENKKHIDLSAEPLILAVLHDLRSDLVSDAVKEVSIFAAHRAVTVVICDRDGELYRSHTPHVLEMPPIGHGLGSVTAALVGHLFAYHTAVAMDDVCQRLRRLRKELLRTSGTPARRHSLALADEARSLLADLLRGDLDALWPARTAGRLTATFQMLASDSGTAAEAVSLILSSDEEAEGTLDVDDWCRNQLSTAVADSTRSIDSIRHQAKTITVGTSRSGYSRTSVMGSALAELGVGIEDLPLSLHSALLAVDAMAELIPSGIRYAVTREPSTDGNDELHLRSKQKIGLAADLESRFDQGAPLAGTKLTSVRRRQPLVVLGIRDGAKLLVFPILQDGKPVEVVLLHLELAGEVNEKQKLRFLEAFPQRTEQLADYFGEMLGRQVDLHELARLGAESLLFAAPASLTGEELSL